MANATGTTSRSGLSPPFTARLMRAGGPLSTTTGNAGPPRLRQHGVLRGRLARSAKYLLPVLAITVAAAIFVWSQTNLPIIRLRISDSEVTPREVDALSMSNPRFAGTDAEDRQFVVTATTATQSPDDEDILHLLQPRADILLANGTTVRIDADTGRYRRESELLDLGGSVTLKDERGYEFHTTQAHVDLKRNRARGHEPIDGTMPDGTLKGEGFRIERNGALLLLLGRSRVVLDSVNQDDEEKASE